MITHSDNVARVCLSIICGLSLSVIISPLQFSNIFREVARYSSINEKVVCPLILWNLASIFKIYDFELHYHMKTLSNHHLLAITLMVHKETVLQGAALDFQTACESLCELCIFQYTLFFIRLVNFLAEPQYS